MALNEITIPIEETHRIDQHIRDLENEIKFLKQRNSDLRKKSYINVYDENLQLVKTVDQLRKELIKVGEIADRFRKDVVDLQKENLHLKDVLKSVEAFCQQYSIR